MKLYEIINFLRNNGGEFLSEAFQLEKKKLIMPVLMSLLLFAGAASTLTLQDGLSETVAENSLNAMTELTVLFITENQYNSTLNTSVEERQEDLRMRNEIRQLEVEARPLFHTRVLLSNFAFKSGLFPLAPEAERPIISDKVAAKSFALMMYRQERLQQLGRKANRSENYSYSEFQADVEEIKSKKWDSPEVQQFLDNYSNSETTGPAFGRLGDELIEKAKTGNFSELSYASFIPSIIATFIAYFVLNALLVETGRKTLHLGREKALENNQGSSTQESSEVQ